MALFCKSTRGRSAWSKMHRIKKLTPLSITNFLRPLTLLYQKLSFVNEKTEKNELFHFSQEIYVINSCPKRENVPKWVLFNNNPKNENKVRYRLALGNFWPKNAHGVLLNFFVETCLIWDDLVNIFENWLIGCFFSSIFVKWLKYYSRFENWWKTWISEIHYLLAWLEEGVINFKNVK